MLEVISLTTILAIVSFVLAVVWFSKSNIHILLSGILFVNMATELALLFATLNKEFKLIVFLYNQYVIIHQFLWLFLIIYVLKKQQFEYLISVFFGVFCLIVALTVVPKNINVYCFLVSFFLFTAYYLFKHYQLLKLENLKYFKSTKFLLLSSPLLFFFSLAFMFGFANSEIRKVQLFGFYFEELLSRLGSLTYYLFIMWYLYLQKKSIKTPENV